MKMFEDAFQENKALLSYDNLLLVIPVLHHIIDLESSSVYLVIKLHWEKKTRENCQVWSIFILVPG